MVDSLGEVEGFILGSNCDYLFASAIPSTSNQCEHSLPKDRHQAASIQ